MSEFTYLELAVATTSWHSPEVPDDLPAKRDKGRTASCMLDVLYGMGWEVVSDSAPIDDRRVLLRKAI